MVRGARRQSAYTHPPPGVPRARAASFLGLCVNWEEPTFAAMAICVVGPRAAPRAAAHMQDEINRNLTDMGMPTAAAIFTALASSKSFHEKFWERRPFVLRACNESRPATRSVLPLWTVEAQLRTLTTTRLSHFFTSPGIARGNVRSFTGEHLRTSSRLRRKQVLKRLGRGETWAFNHAEGASGSDFAPLRHVTAAAQRAFGLPAGVNVYVSALDTAMCAPLHTDRMNSLVLQAEGRKTWRVWAPPRGFSLPVIDAGFVERGKEDDVLEEAELGASPLIEIVLGPGDVLYLPRGFPHTTATSTTSAVSKKAVKAGSQHQSEHDSLGREAHNTVPQYSTSLTLSLLSETVSLTADKLMRCLGGRGARCAAGQRCDAASEVLEAALSAVALRRTLPVGFLSSLYAGAKAAPKSFPRVRASVDQDGTTRATSEVTAQAASEAAAEATPQVAHVTRDQWADGMCEYTAKLSSIVQGGALRAALPPCREQRRVLTHLFDGLASLIDQRSGDLERNHSSPGASPSAGSLEMAYATLWPEECHMFVKPR